MWVLKLSFLVSLLLAAGYAQQSREEEVRFQNKEVTLAGTLLLPTTTKQVPAIVLVHGSGPEPRSTLRVFAQRFTQLGIAALIYDKRGVGESTGQWYRASLDDLASDALAGARFLRSRGEVDPARIGIWGISQGGWVILRANIAEPSAFKFAVAVTGGGVKPSEVERYDYAARMNAMGLTPEDKLVAQKVVDDYLRYLGGNVSRSVVEHDIAANKDASWFKAVDVSRIMPDEADRKQWAWVPQYDPVPDMTKLKMPVLVLLGGKDRPELSETELRNWRTDLAENSVASIFLSLSAGHGMTVGAHHHPGAPQTFVPEYLDSVDVWLRAHALAP